MVSGPTVTVMPHTGSTAWRGRTRGSRPGVGASPSSLMALHDRREDRQRDLGRRAGADVDAHVRVHAVPLLLGEVELGEHRLTAGVAGDEPDEPDAGVQRRADRSRLVSAVARDHRGDGAVGPGALAARSTDEAERGRQRRHRLGGRRGPDEVQRRRRAATARGRSPTPLLTGTGSPRCWHPASAGRCRRCRAAPAGVRRPRTPARRAQPSAPSRPRTVHRRIPRWSRRRARSPGRPHAPSSAPGRARPSPARTARASG